MQVNNFTPRLLDNTSFCLRALPFVRPIDQVCRKFAVKFRSTEVSLASRASTAYSRSVAAQKQCFLDESRFVTV